MARIPRPHAKKAAMVAVITSLFTTTSAWGSISADPEIAWAPCADNAALDCAVLTVPMDHSNPGSGPVELALTRSPATNPDARTGSLVLHRGGPGYGSGDYLRQILDGQVQAPVTDDVRAQYDLVTVDQRGTGQSRPAVRCFASEEEASGFGSDLPLYPTTDAERAERIEHDRTYAEGCAENTGELLEHLNTVDAARDLDLVRAALGDERLNFLGQSYGGHLGTVYAHLFPEHVGQTVLDSVLGSEAQAGALPGELRSARIGSDTATDEVFEEFARQCVANDFACSFGADDPVTAFDEIRASLATAPVELTTVDGRSAMLTESYLVRVTAAFLYQPTVWSALLAPTLAAVEAAVADPSSESGQAIATDLLEGSGVVFAPYGEIQAPYLAVTCTDSDHPDSPAAFVEAVEERTAHAARFAETRAWEDSACASWAVGSANRFDGPWGAETATPVLIINNRFDPATPLAGAKRAANLLAGSHLLINEGPGHIASQQSSCTVEAASRYLLDGTMPGEGATCESDPLP